MEEIWKPIKDYEKYYEVSNLGRIKRLPRIQIYPDGHTQLLKEKILKGSTTTWGYLQVSLTKDGKRIKKHIHTLVAEAFIPNPNNLSEVNHKDYNKENNYVDNLEWCTHNANMQDMFEHYNIKIHYKKYCIDCNKELYSDKCTRCIKCSNIINNKNKAKVKNRPDRETLKQLIRNNSMLMIGRMFGVSDNAIRKWCMKYNLPYKSTVIKCYSDIEWALL